MAGPAHFLHVLSAFAFAGGALGANITRIILSRSEELSDIISLLQIEFQLAVLARIGIAFATAFGLWAASIEFNMGANWLIISYVFVALGGVVS